MSSCKNRSRTFFLLLWLTAFIAFSGCNKSGDAENPGEYAFVSAPQVALRDRVAAVFNKVGYVANGERVRVLERSSNKRFVRVRTDDGKEGWVEQRFLVGQDVFQGFAKLASENAQAPSQATAITRRLVNLHVLPSRDADSLYQLKEGSKVELLKRASTPKIGLKAIANEEKKEDKAKAEEEKNNPDEAAEGDEATLPAKPAAKSKLANTKLLKSKSGKRGHRDKAPILQTPMVDGSPLEDWWLVRDAQKHVGWLLGRMVDVDVPLEIAEYAEGQRIVASFVLSRVTVSDPTAPDGKKQIPQYAVLLSEPRDGMPFDFNQLRVFTWNARRSRYETAYRERFDGEMPFVVGKEDFGREGVLPVFTVKVHGADGKLEERKYKMSGVIVRRVLLPGEAPPARAKHFMRRK